MTVLAPILFYFLFAYGFPLDAKNVPMAVLDYDKTQMSRSLINSFENASDIFHIKMVANNYEEATHQLDLGYIRMLLVVPKNFELNIKKGMEQNIQVLIDGAYPNTANITGGYVDAIVGAFRAEVLFKHFITRPGFENINAVPIDLTVSTWYNPSFRSEDFIIPAIIALVMVFLPPIVGAISLAREKETGSILNMYCSSITKSEYLLGKMTPYIIISYINYLMFLIFTVYLFHVPFRGSVSVLLFSGFFYIAGVIGVGLFVAILVKSQVAAILITFVGTVMPAFLYTGFMVPISSMAESAKQTSYMLPTTYFIRILRNIMVKGVGYKLVLTDTVILIVFSIGLYALCIKLFKKRIG